MKEEKHVEYVGTEPKGLPSNEENIGMRPLPRHTGQVLSNTVIVAIFVVQ